MFQEREREREREREKELEHCEEIDYQENNNHSELRGDPSFNNSGRIGIILPHTTRQYYYPCPLVWLVGVGVVSEELLPFGRGVFSGIRTAEVVEVVVGEE